MLGKLGFVAWLATQLGRVVIPGLNMTISGAVYALVLGIIFTSIGFLDENSLIQRVKHRSEISALNSEIEKYRKQYEEDTEKLKELTTNPEALEKIAREKYLMKKPDEDIFVFEE